MSNPLGGPWLALLPLSLAAMCLVTAMGCRSELRSTPSRVTPLPGPQSSVGPRNAEPAGASAVPGVEASNRVQIEPVPDVVPQESPASGVKISTNSWISVSSWCLTNGLPGCALVLFQGRHLLQGAGTALDLVPGAPLAKWRGANCWLAFPLRWAASGDLLANAMDIEKTLKPLLSMAPVPPRGISKGVLVLDPGHGGRNVGTQSVSDGKFEKELTLDLAFRLSPLLERRGWTVVMSRTNDVDISVAERVATADLHSAKLFLSLHFNSEPTHIQSGIETYCLTPVGMNSHLIRDFSDRPDLEFPNNSYDDENLRLSIRLHHALVNASGQADRGVRRARYPGVLRLQNRPSVLVEAGYLSNQKEGLLISQSSYRQRLAESLASALD